MKSPSAPRCLVVEDEPLIARALVRDLEQLGVRVSVASSLAAAQALTGQFDCAVVDLDLPDGCGLNIQSMFPEGTLLSEPVFFSATVEEKLLAEATALGTFIPKSAGTAAAVRAACQALTRAQASGKSGTFLRPSSAPSELYGAARAKASDGKTRA